jgi:2-polyprenyl-6-methoxyphenol hydroxylase-like FAD-dependent oxidoreductase
LLTEHNPEKLQTFLTRLCVAKEHNPDMTNKLNILIVGAGPVGLTAAVELTRRGFKPRILEKDVRPHVGSRALAINPRTLDILEPSGASLALLDAGIKAKAMNFNGPSGPLFRLDMKNMPHRSRDYMLVLPQAQTERLLMETLGGNGKIDWGTELTALDVKQGKPIVTLENKGRAEKFTPDIVIAADGAHSTVRTALGINFIGQAYEHDWGLADIRVSGLTPNELHVFDLSPLMIAFIPIGGDLFRVVGDHPDVLVTLPPHVTVNKVEWVTHFRISHRLVETYQAGPVYLAGDAAHIHSPAGGRGMNLGIEDAAWLAYLIDRGESEAYTRLRHPIAKKVIAQTDAMTRFISSDSKIMTFARQNILPVVASRRFAQRKILLQISGLSAPTPPWLKNERQA